MASTLLKIAAPSVIDILQADHEHVLTMYHEYRADASPRPASGERRVAAA